MLYYQIEKQMQKFGQNFAQKKSLTFVLHQAIQFFLHIYIYTLSQIHILIKK